MRRIIVSAALAAVLFSGCQWDKGPEELARLVKEDPAFRNMIVHRDRSHAAVAIIKSDLLTKKKALDAQIEKLRADYDLYAKEQQKKIEQHQASIDALRSKLKSEISSSDSAIEAKTVELEGYEKTLVDVQRMLNQSKGITLSAEEKKKWQERLLMLSEKIRPLREEIQELKLQIRLKKQKTGYLD